MDEELYKSVEYRAGDKHGTLDYDSFRVVREVHAGVEKNRFGTKEITFSRENVHAGMIAAMIAEMLPAFNDEEIPTLTVRETTLSVLQALGLDYIEVEEDKTYHAEELFRKQTEPLQPAGD